MHFVYSKLLIFYQDKETIPHVESKEMWAIFTVYILTQPLEHIQLQHQAGHTPIPSLSQVCEVAVRDQDPCVITYNNHILMRQQPPK